jgi:hypothetical protein
MNKPVRLAMMSIAAIAGLLLASISTVIPPPADAQSTVSLTVNTQYADGTSLTGMWTVIRQNDNIVATGFSPITFNLNSGASYTISVGDYQGTTFHHWDNDSTARVRPISITAPTTVIAYYVSDVHPLPQEDPDPQEDEPSSDSAVVVMENTNITNSYGIYSTKPARAEYATASSVLVGKQIDEITVAVRRVGTITGEAQIGVFDAGGGLKKLFGTLDVASVPATAHPNMSEYAFSIDDLYTIAAGDRIGIWYGGGTSNEYLAVALDYDLPAFDESNSYHQYYQNNVWNNSPNTQDMWLILKQNKETESGGNGDGGGTEDGDNEDALAPITHMEDTTATQSYGIYAGKPARAEYVTLTSSLVGKQIDEMTVALRRVGTVSGQVHVGVLNPDGSVKHLFGTINAASIPAAGHPSGGIWPETAQYTFTSEDLYTIQAGDRIGVHFSDDGDGSNYIAVALDYDPADPFDGSSSYLQYYDTSWKQVGTDKDLWLILKQNKEAPPPPPPAHVLLRVEAARLDGTAVSGVYTVIHKNGEVQIAQNAPLDFAAEVGTTYTITPSDYEIFASGSYTFEQWHDGETARSRIFNLDEADKFTAHYSYNADGIVSVSVRSADLEGNALSGLYFDISPTKNIVMPGYSPLAYTLEAGVSYTVAPQDYGSYVFSHWHDGDLARERMFVPLAGMELTAHFELLPPGEQADDVPPQIAIHTPASGRIVTSMSATIAGTASDNIGVTRVEVAVDDDEFERADGLQRWSYLTPKLSNGMHVVTVRAYDAVGNYAEESVDFSVQPDAILPKTGLYVAMYMKPTGAGLGYYQDVADAKNTHPSLPIVAAVNPASGPGTASDAEYEHAIGLLNDAGVLVLGYVPTKYGSRDIEAVKTDIDKWIEWYSVGGIMLDEFPNQAGYESKYAEITAYAKSLGLSFVMGNAGTDVPQSYLGTVDIIGITEGHGYMPTEWLQYCVLCMSDGWHQDYDKNNFKVVRYAIDSLDAEFVREASKWAGLIYITDGVSPARWTHLPPYFDDLIALLDE